MEQAFGAAGVSEPGSWPTRSVIFGFCATDKAYGAQHLGHPCGKVGVLAFAHGPSAPIAQRPGQMHNRANSSATTRADESEMPLHSRHAGRLRRRPQQLD
jgi:hypothetical protein